MQVRFKRSGNGHGFGYNAGERAELPPDKAEALIKAGVCEAEAEASTTEVNGSERNQDGSGAEATGSATESLPTETELPFSEIVEDQQFEADWQNVKAKIAEAAPASVPLPLAETELPILKTEAAPASAVLPILKTEAPATSTSKKRK